MSRPFAWYNMTSESLKRKSNFGYIYIGMMYGQKNTITGRTCHSRPISMSIEIEWINKFWKIYKNIYILF